MNLPWDSIRRSSLAIFRFDARLESAIMSMLCHPHNLSFEPNAMNLGDNFSRHLGIYIANQRWEDPDIFIGRSKVHDASAH